MFRRRYFWAAFLTAALCFTAGAAPVASDAGTVTWILLGGKKQAAKVSGLQLFADSTLDHSILLAQNRLVWANGFIVTDEECPDEHFHGQVGDLEDRGKACGLGTVARYADSPAPIQHASDALMSQLTAANFLSNVRFADAATAAEGGRLQLEALKQSLQTADPQQFPTWRLALPAVNTAIQSQTDARDILVRLSQQTSNRLAIRRAEQALKRSAQNSRRAFTLLVGNL